MPSLRLLGSPVFSAFRREKLLSALRDVNADIQDVQAFYEHFVDLKQELVDREFLALKELLSYGPAYEDSSFTGKELLVVPRIGTISPWSSKATDIAHNCGLKKINRLERGVRFTFKSKNSELNSDDLSSISHLIHDRMTETCSDSEFKTSALFSEHSPALLEFISLSRHGSEAIEAANKDLGLALSEGEIEYLIDIFSAEGRDPTDAELMMFSQANSEHCRHKIFNADWIIDGSAQRNTLFEMIRMTHKTSSEGVLSAYTDNSAVIAGGEGFRLSISNPEGSYDFRKEDIHILMKVETHNHPTAISPFAGAATGAGGEIRDEGATGRGAEPKAGLTGFSVSHLRIPGFLQSWEDSIGLPKRIASPYSIMLDGPIGGAAFNNEFGRPNVLGYFRTFEQLDPQRPNFAYGYHKPIMIAGGIGNIREPDVIKPDVPSNALIIILGGPSMLIGLGGGAASSLGSGSSDADLDFASVQRGNPEIQRRAQQVIDACYLLGSEAKGHNPIIIIHDVGAGGLSNAIPELINHSSLGADIDLRAIPNAEPGMSPLEIWCNESQERYVIALLPDDVEIFSGLCERERCPFAIVGQMNDSGRLIVNDSENSNRPIDMEIESLLGKTPQTLKKITSRERTTPDNELDDVDLVLALKDVLKFPTVANKSFLIHIADRTVGGMVAQDQLVGPWQTPVSDVAVLLRSFKSSAGEAMSMGERAPVAVINPAASGRLAVGEAITNIAAARVESISDIRFSANWMAASGSESEDQALFETVSAVGKDLCRELGIAIPVGKDSLSMETRWEDNDDKKVVMSPLSLIISAFAPVVDVRQTLTPQLKKDNTSKLYLIDLGDGYNRLGSSCLSQALKKDGGAPADLVSPKNLKEFFSCIQSSNAMGHLVAYHDRSDGGLITCLAEMMFAGRVGIDINFSGVDSDQIIPALFSEELGAVVQVPGKNCEAFEENIYSHGLKELCRPIAKLNTCDQLRIFTSEGLTYSESRIDLQCIWSEVSYRMQAERDNPVTAKEEFETIRDAKNPGLSPKLTFDLNEDIAAPFLNLKSKPKVAILREQGVNSHYEMAAAFHRVGFDPIDVHMTDLISDRFKLDDFRGLIACGGFSYGDVLGAGGGWAKSILLNNKLRDQFQFFFESESSFSLGICNGCQMLSGLKGIIPGAKHWPRFITNRSEQFEARLSLVEVLDSSSIFLKDMEGSMLPIVVSHGEGRAEFSDHESFNHCSSSNQFTIRFIDNFGHPTEHYPSNPNGSPAGVAGLCNEDGRVSIFMPHPERVHLSAQHSWHPDNWGEVGPWMRLFRNARVWIG
ncbi:MAG: phosphoribosylformylglycinamidine synthase [Pseudomonadota bacterium]|nr:phosphoribosylformylglycinamidine synthase [Pseudomonadota bacterium]